VTRGLHPNPSGTDVGTVGGRTEDAQADQTHFIERTVTVSPQPDVLSMA
jgi:hypothetical protein